MTINKLIKEYLAQNKKKITFVDSFGSYTIKKFTEKVLFYKSEILKIKKKDKIDIDNFGVAILLERNIDYIAIIFSCWLLNIFYIPLSTISKKDFINYQLKKSNALYLFKQEKNNIKLNKNQFYKNKKSIKSLNEEKIAYMIFTSGSTGEKKGVAISRKNLNAYIKGIKSNYEKKMKFKSLMINGELTFDISVADFVFALLFKSKVIITSNSSNLISLFNHIKKDSPEAIYAVPTTWKRIVDYSNKFEDINFSKVKYINSGGEALTKDLVYKIYKVFPNSYITNFYGPTEFTINATYFEITKQNFKKYDVMPIGKCLPNIKFLIKKKSSKDKYGELYLSGPQMMKGYINFKQPFKESNSICYYPTGDLVYLDKDNLINYYARIADYEKISGYRVNLLSIENKIKKHIDLNIFIISNSNKIFLFFESNKNIKDSKNKLINISKSNLENYEIPSNFIELEKIPINSSGKPDKSALINLAKI